MRAFTRDHAPPSSPAPSSVRGRSDVGAAGARQRLHAGLARARRSLHHNVGAGELEGKVFEPIDVDKWMGLLEAVQRSAGTSCLGALATASMTRAIVVNTRQTIDALPNLPAVRNAVKPVLEPLALVESRTASYLARLEDIPEKPNVDERIDCERIYYWLTSGVTPDEPPAPPVLDKGDARLAAELWNQVAAVASTEAAIVEGHPFPDAFTLMRETIGNTIQAFESSAPGEIPTVRESVVETLTNAAKNARDFVTSAAKSAADEAKSLLMWGAALVGGALVLYLAISANRG